MSSTVSFNTADGEQRVPIILLARACKISCYDVTQALIIKVPFLHFQLFEDNFAIARD